MTSPEERIAHLQRELDWAERIIAVLMDRPKPPPGTIFDTTDLQAGEDAVDALKSIASSSTDGRSRLVAEQALVRIGL